MNDQKPAKTEAIDRLFLELSQFTRATSLKEQDLAMLVIRLARYIRKIEPMNPLAHDAIDFICRKGFVQILHNVESVWPYQEPKPLKKKRGKRR